LYIVTSRVLTRKQSTNECHHCDTLCSQQAYE